MPRPATAPAAGKSGTTASSSAALARDIVTPVTSVLFLVSTVTGVMLLAHWNGSLVRFSHEWLSLVFSALALWHLARNWRAFTGYLRRRLPLVVLMGSLALSIVLTGLTGSPAKVSPGAVFHRLSDARLEQAAPALGFSPDQAVALLRDQGIPASPTDSLTAIGRTSGLGGAGVLTLLATAPVPGPTPTSGPTPGH